MLSEFFEILLVTVLLLGEGLQFLILKNPLFLDFLELGLQLLLLIPLFLDVFFLRVDWLLPEDVVSYCLRRLYGEFLFLVKASY